MHQIDVRARIESLNWRQGSIVPLNEQFRAAVRMLPFAELETIPDSQAWLIIVSQDCDIASDHLDAEPAVEVLVALPIEREQERYRNVRHPRELHLSLDGDGGVRQAVALRIRNRGLIERRLLMEHGPSENWKIRSNLIDQIASFVGGRYTRVAYPGAFEDRFRRAKKALAGVMERYSEEIQDIFLVVRPFEEVADGERYDLTVYAIVHDHVADGPANRYNTLKQEIAAEVRRPIRKCEGIDLEKVSVCGRDEITLREFGRMMPLDFGADG